MSTINYKCPCCASALTYSGTTGKLECTSCGNQFDLEALEALELPQEGGTVEFALNAETFSDADSASIDAYHCKNCGAELICEATTTATECPYCGSPTILPDRIQGGVKPEKVVPFTVSKETATRMFQDYFKGKRLLPNIFIKSDNHIQEVRKLYVPYWLFDCQAEGDILYDAEKKHTQRNGEWEIINTEHYAVRRTGTLDFVDIPVDGSEKLDNNITESLEPYDLTKAVPFQSAVLSGAMADHADKAAEDCRARAAERVAVSTESALTSTVSGYSSVNVRKKAIKSDDGKATPVLMPVWLITTVKDLEGTRKTYTFAINGQSGKLTCDVPYAKGKAFAWTAGVFAVTMVIAYLLMMLMDMADSGTLVIAAIVSLIVALCVVGGMKAKLHTAGKQSSASNYIRQGSLKLSRKDDRYLYTSTERRKIQTAQTNEIKTAAPTTRDKSI